MGFGTAKAVIASRAVTVHASTLFGSLAGAGGWSITNVTAFTFFPRSHCRKINFYSSLEKPLTKSSDKELNQQRTFQKTTNTLLAREVIVPLLRRAVPRTKRKMC